MKKILLSFCLLLFGFIYSQHKFLETPKLSEEDLKREKSEKYPDAPAEVLYRSIHFRVDYDGYIYKDVTDRVKIYNKDNASNFLDHQISIYKNNQGKRETLSDLKAFTSSLKKIKIIRSLNLPFRM